MAIRWTDRPAERSWARGYNAPKTNRRKDEESKVHIGRYEAVTATDATLVAEFCSSCGLLRVGDTPDFHPVDGRRAFLYRADRREEMLGIMEAA